MVTGVTIEGDNKSFPNNCSILLIVAQSVDSGGLYMHNNNY